MQAGKELKGLVPSGTRTCSKCKQVKPCSEFYHDKRNQSNGGYRYQCKSCIRAYTTVCKKQRHENYLRLKNSRNRCPDCEIPISPWLRREDQLCPSCAARRLGNQAIKTALELDLSKALDDLGLDHIAQQCFPGCFYIYDEYVPELNLLIEADGERWHYSEQAKEWGIPEKDARKDQWAIDHGYRIIHVRERDSDFKGMKACLAEQLFSQLEF